MEQVSLSKQKKIFRKLNKLRIALTKETGIEFSSCPTESLAVCNVGLANGLTKELLFEHFSKQGTLTNINLLPGKSYCFVSYLTIESAAKANEAFNGKLNIAQDNKPIYMLYVPKIPLVDNNDIWHELPPGLIVLKDYITSSEEKNLLDMHNFTNQIDGNMKHRLVKHYGYEFRYDINNVDKDKPLNEKIPSQCDFLWERLSNERPEFKHFKPDQLTINFYSPGHGSSIVMDFKNGDKHICVLLPQRSLLIMSGESRYDWNHGIVPRKFDVIKDPASGTYSCLKRGVRVSLTFRKILQGICDCVYTDKCDSFKSRGQIVENNVAAKLEKLHVHQVYENIADHFSDTRHKPWPNVLEFIQSFETGSVLIDAGCGNGKYLGRQDLYDIGFDYSAGLINICKNRGHEVCVGDCLNIPIKDNSADGILSIAVIHHLANKNRRLEALKEIVRVLRIGGKALIYVWAKDQLKGQEKSSYIKQDRKNRKSLYTQAASVSYETETVNLLDGTVSFPVHTNRTQFKTQDVLVPWKLKDENKTTFLRFYHVFENNELELLCNSLNNVKILKSYYDQGNMCIILEKINN
ncbi:hypothetical protein GWI33_002673 [Rhynchophorus ferrugineus]|uniref:RRM domain-containing protein n=1 Tax=Rhynchophorus ferrugineus TaxID=354439 RepID=A0A834IQX4_RHYFE|nr:hypothetical protein GWI33_002673 [Rhynchophorus ferrugineus]